MPGVMLAMDGRHCPIKPDTAGAGSLLEQHGGSEWSVERFHENTAPNRHGQIYPPVCPLSILDSGSVMSLHPLSVFGVPNWLPSG